MRSVKIIRFTPLDFKFCDPDAPVFYNELPKEDTISSDNDVIRLGKQLYEAEKKAYELQYADEMIEAIADSAMQDLAECQRVLLAVGTHRTIHLAKRLGKLYLRLKAPSVACIVDCLEEIYIREGMDAVKEVLGRMADEKKGN